MRAIIRFPERIDVNRDPRIWFLLPELEGWYPMLIEVTGAVLSFELLPGGQFRALMLERPLRLAGPQRLLARYEVTGSYESDR